jgi:uncharacterized membrane-anchored protein YjiN (DUF445 family)
VISINVTNKHKATFTLGLAIIGYVVSYPFSYTFTGGLLASGFGAAVVGGLADWFAVSALFRKPFGIPFRTAVIPRNRERIIKAISETVEGDLLTKENLQETLKGYDTGAMLMRYLTEYNGKQHIKTLAVKVSDDIFAAVEADKIGNFIAASLHNSNEKIQMDALLAPIVQWSLEHGYVDKLVEVAIAEFSNMARQKEFRLLLFKLIREGTAVYEKDVVQRQIVGKILGKIGFTNAKLAVLAQTKILELLARLESPAHPWRILLKGKIGHYALKTVNDPVMQVRMEEWKSELLGTERQSELGETIALAVKSLLDERRRSVYHRWIDIQIERLVATLKQDHNKQQKLGAWLRQGFLALIDSHHHNVGTIVREKLEEFTPDAMVTFIETRVSNDLQMIRINGSIVGGIVGMLIFLLTSWW